MNLHPIACVVPGPAEFVLVYVGVFILLAFLVLGGLWLAGNAMDARKERRKKDAEFEDGLRRLVLKAVENATEAGK